MVSATRETLLEARRIPFVRHADDENMYKIYFAPLSRKLSKSRSFSVLFAGNEAELLCTTRCDLEHILLHARRLMSTVNRKTHAWNTKTSKAVNSKRPVQIEVKEVNNSFIWKN